MENLKVYPRDERDNNDPFCGVGLGDRVKDTLSNFTGVVISRCEYMTGCNQVFVFPSTEKDNEMPNGQWIDIERIEKISHQAVSVERRLGGVDIVRPNTTGRRA